MILRPCSSPLLLRPCSCAHAPPPPLLLAPARALPPLTCRLRSPAACSVCSVPSTRMDPRPQPLVAHSRRIIEQAEREAAFRAAVPVEIAGVTGPYAVAINGASKRQRVAACQNATTPQSQPTVCLPDVHRPLKHRRCHQRLRSPPAPMTHNATMHDAPAWSTACWCLPPAAQRTRRL